MKTDNYPNRPGQGARVGDHSIGAAGDIVPARSRHRGQRRYHRFLLPGATNGIIDFLRDGYPAAAGVDMNHDCFDRSFFGPTIDLPDPFAAGVLIDDPENLNHADIATQTGEREIAVTRHQTDEHQSQQTHCNQERESDYDRNDYIPFACHGTPITLRISSTWSRR